MRRLERQIFSDEQQCASGKWARASGDSNRCKQTAMIRASACAPPPSSCATAAGRFAVEQIARWSASLAHFARFAQVCSDGGGGSDGGSGADDNVNDDRCRFLSRAQTASVRARKRTFGSIAHFYSSAQLQRAFFFASSSSLSSSSHVRGDKQDAD